MISIFLAYVHWSIVHYSHRFIKKKVYGRKQMLADSAQPVSFLLIWKMQGKKSGKSVNSGLYWVQWYIQPCDCMMPAIVTWHNTCSPQAPVLRYLVHFSGEDNNVPMSAKLVPLISGQLNSFLFKNSAEFIIVFFNLIKKINALYDLLLTINDWWKLLFWLTVPNYACMYTGLSLFNLKILPTSQLFHLC